MSEIESCINEGVFGKKKFDLELLIFRLASAKLLKDIINNRGIFMSTLEKRIRSRSSSGPFLDRLIGSNASV